MNPFRKLGDWFARVVDNRMAKSPLRATEEEAKRTEELAEKYKKWAGESEGTTDKNKDSL